MKEFKIPLSQPDITDLERRYVMEVLQTPNLSLGPKLPEFEKKVSDYVGTRFAVAVNSGTSALHCCIKSFGIGPGDEVITSPFSFIATSNTALFEGAKPVFVDIDPDTYNIDFRQIEEKITERTKAIIPVHVFGLPAEMDAINKIAKKYNLRVLEDAAEAIGAEYKKRKAGSLGDCAVFAFYPNKQITTGEGGIIVTDNESLAALCRSLRNQGRGDTSGWLQHQRLGYNYRLSDINCALGIAQMERLSEILDKRTRVAQWYLEQLHDVPELTTQQIPANCKKSWFVFVVALSPLYSKKSRDEILSHLRKKGIACSNYFSPIHLQPFMAARFGYKEGDFPVTESLSKRTIALPFFANLSKENVRYVTDVLKNSL